MKINPKGIVEPIEMNILYDKIRILLGDRKNVANESDWLSLQRYTTKMRCFTYCERDNIESCFEDYLRWKRKHCNPPKGK